MSEVVDQVLSEVVAKRLQGELLTIADAVSGDKVQRDAIKSLTRQSVQKCLAELTVRLEVIKTEKEEPKSAKS